MSRDAIFVQINRVCHDAESIHESCQVEPCEVKQLNYFFVRENSDEIGRARRIRLELNDFRLAVSVGQLDKAEAIPRMVKSHGFGVHGDDFVRNEVVREIIDMKSVGQFRRNFCSLRISGLNHNCEAHTIPQWRAERMRSMLK